MTERQQWNQFLKQATAEIYGQLPKEFKSRKLARKLLHAYLGFCTKMWRVTIV